MTGFWHNLAHKTTKSLLCMVGFCMAFSVSAHAVSINLFPVEYTDQSGDTLWGYMNEKGTLEIDYIYTSAQIFDTLGFAAVTNELGQTALLDTDGTQCTAWLEGIVSVEYDNKTIALRTDAQTTYIDNNGNLIATIEDALGFPNDDLVCVLRVPETDPEATTEEAAEIDTVENPETTVVADQTPLYGYVDLDNQMVIAPSFTQASEFQSGRALVLMADGLYHQIDTAGNSTSTLPVGAIPANLTISSDDLVILQSADNKYGVYSLAESSFVTSFIYDTILPFSGGVAQVQRDGLWGLLDASGAEIMAPTYPYMTALGENMYAVHGTDGSAACINAQGASIYQTDAYVGGFDSFRHGLSWHGTLDGSVMIYNAAGTFARTFENADSATIVTTSVARLVHDNQVRYVDIFNNQTLLTITRSDTLDTEFGTLTVTSKTYERWLGMYDDGTDYGWTITYPVISGFDDDILQTQINTALSDFFMQGPSSITENLPITSTYGFAIEGDVLVVWANGTIGSGKSAYLWNESCGIDLTTGQSYDVLHDLLDGDYFTVLSSLLPQGENYGNPRMGAQGITWYRNRSAASTGTPYADTIFLTYEQMAETVQFNGACYASLTGIAIPSFTDVPSTHWAYPTVSIAVGQGLMQGYTTQDVPSEIANVVDLVFSNATEEPTETADATTIESPLLFYFFPNANVSQKEVFIAFAQLLDYFPTATNSSEIAYGDAMAALYDAGLLSRFNLQPNSTLTRLELMQFLADVYLMQGVEAPTEDEMDALLSPFADAAALTNESMRQAVAICLQQGIINGDGTQLALTSNVTRAALAKVCATFVCA